MKMKGKIKNRRVLFKDKKFSKTVSIIVLMWNTRDGKRYQLSIKDRYRGHHIANTPVMEVLEECVFAGLELAYDADRLSLAARERLKAKKSKLLYDVD